MSTIAMAKNIVNITVNVTAHSEGLLLHKTLRSVIACYEYAINNGILYIEFNLSLDKPSVETIRIANYFLKKYNFIKLHTVNFGDLAEHRNYLITKSKGKYIAFFDGDDLFTENYLFSAYNIAEKNNKPAVYSAEYIVSFEEQNYISRKMESKDRNFHTINCFEYNYFISQNIVHRNIYLKNKYKPNRSGYGMEDWDWNNRVLNNGFEFINIPNTVFFYRRKKNGLIGNQVENHATLRPSPLYDPKNYLKYEKYSYNYSQKGQIDLDTRKKRDALKDFAKILTLGTETGYEYLQKQYNLNKQYLSKTKNVIKNKLNINHPIPNSMDDQKNRTTIFDIGINEDIVKLWKKINYIEPMIIPSQNNLVNLPVIEYPENSLLSLMYYELCKIYGLNVYSDLLLVPHITKGGADLAIINLVTLLSQKTESNILVISTTDIKSIWADRITKLPNVRFIEITKYLDKFNNDERLLIVLRIIQNWGVKRLNIINSGMGYELLEKYGQAVKDVVDTYLHTYAFDMDNEGNIYNYLKNGLVKVYKYTDIYITDSIKYKDQLIEVNGFDKDKIKVLYLPVKEKPRILKSSNHQNSEKLEKVLWASRISDAKLIDVAIEIGKLLKLHGIELHFYGALDHEYKEDNYFDKLIGQHSNIYYHGPYENFFDIPVDEYDIFLLTSKNEGMPNVILEAMASNMFIVAPSVGGISELVKEDINGYLVNEKFSPKAYTDKILQFYKTEINNNKKLKTNQQILKLHSWKAYSDTATKILGI